MYLWLEIDVPIHAGIMPILNRNQALRLISASIFAIFSLASASDSPTVAM